MMKVIIGSTEISINGINIQPSMLDMILNQGITTYDLYLNQYEVTKLSDFILKYYVSYSEPELWSILTLESICKEFTQFKIIFPLDQYNNQFIKSFLGKMIYVHDFNRSWTTANTFYKFTIFPSNSGRIRLK